MRMTAFDANRHAIDRDYHDAIAGEYDDTVVAPRAYCNDRLFGELLPRGRRSRALDLGCGTGHMLRRLAPTHDSVIGVDHSEGMLDVARRALAGFSNVSLVHAEVGAFLQNTQGGFDTVSAVGFLHHLHEQELLGLFTGVRKVLAPDGDFVIAEPIQVSEAVPPAIAAWNARSPILRTRYSIEVEDPDEAPLAEGRLLGMLKESGFEVAAEARCWEVFNHSAQPGWLERWRMGRLYRRYRGQGSVLALRLRGRR